MRKENLSGHLTAIAARHGIANVQSFYRAARRYECKLHYLEELACSSERLYKWAEKESERTEQSARRNLAKYCRNYKQFARELHVNSDPRGYALELEIKNAPKTFYKVDRDWGNYFIIAPDLY